MSKDSALKKIKDFFVTQLSEQEQSALKEFVKPVEVALKEAKTKDGKVLSYEGEWVVGSNVNEVVEGNSVPAEGVYELEDGSKVSCVAGKITEIMPAEVEANKAPELPDVAPIVAAEVATQMSAHKESQEKEISALKEQVVTLTKIVNTILETEISFAPQKEKKEKSYDEMTKAEQVKFNRGKI